MTIQAMSPSEVKVQQMSHPAISEVEEISTGYVLGSIEDLGDRGFYVEPLDEWATAPAKITATFEQATAYILEYYGRWVRPYLSAETAPTGFPEIQEGCMVS